MKDVSIKRNANSMSRLAVRWRDLLGVDARGP